MHKSTFSEKSANYGRKKRRPPQGVLIPGAHTHTQTHTPYVGVNRGVTIILLLQALLLRLISKLREISCGRTRGKEGEKELKRETSHIHL